MKTLSQNQSLLFIIKSLSLTKNRSITEWNWKQTPPPLTLSLPYTVKAWNFTISRFHSRLLQCYFYKKRKILELFSKLILKTLKTHPWNIPLLLILSMFLSAGLFTEATTQRNSKKDPYLHVQECSRFMTKFLHSKRVISLVKVKA